jgi:hypothetical protein
MTDTWFASLAVAPGPHALTSEGRLAANVYGFGSYDAYTYGAAYDCTDCLAHLTDATACH